MFRAGSFGMSDFTINVHSLSEAGQEVSFVVPHEWFVFFSETPKMDFTVSKSGEAHIKIQQLGKKYHVAGALQYELVTECVCCLEPFSIAMKSHIQKLFVSHEEARDFLPISSASQDENILDEVSEDFELYSGNTIDLESTLKESVLLDLPMNPKCRQDCLGLCAHCGKNKNLEQCTCFEVQSPFSKLKNMKFA